MMHQSISHDHQEMMEKNKEYIENMLDLAIKQLVEIAEDNDIWLIDNQHVCRSYDEIFNCLKNRSQKRMRNDE